MKVVSHTTDISRKGNYVKCPICGLTFIAVERINGEVSIRHRCRRCKHYFSVDIAE